MSFALFRHPRRGYPYRNKADRLARSLVEGKEAWIKSMDGSWEPKKIHYGETFIIPASVDKFIIESYEKETVRVIIATMR